MGRLASFARRLFGKSGQEDADQENYEVDDIDLIAQAASLFDSNESDIPRRDFNALVDARLRGEEGLSEQELFAAAHAEEGWNKEECIMHVYDQGVHYKALEFVDKSVYDVSDQALQELADQLDRNVDRDLYDRAVQFEAMRDEMPGERTQKLAENAGKSVEDLNRDVYNFEIERDVKSRFATDGDIERIATKWGETPEKVAGDMRACMERRKAEGLSVNDEVKANIDKVLGEETATPNIGDAMGEIAGQEVDRETFYAAVDTRVRGDKVSEEVMADIQASELGIYNMEYFELSVYRGCLSAKVLGRPASDSVFQEIAEKLEKTPEDIRKDLYNCEIEMHVRSEHGDIAGIAAKWEKTPDEVAGNMRDYMKELEGRNIGYLISDETRANINNILGEEEPEIGEEIPEEEEITTIVVDDIDEALKDFKGVDLKALELNLAKLHSGKVDSITVETKNGPVQLSTSADAVDKQQAEALRELAEQIKNGTAPDNGVALAVFGEHRDGKGKLGCESMAYTNGNMADVEKLLAMADKIESGQMRADVLNGTEWKEQNIADFCTEAAGFAKEEKQRVMEAANRVREEIEPENKVNDVVEKPEVKAGETPAKTPLEAQLEAKKKHEAITCEFQHDNGTTINVTVVKPGDEEARERLEAYVQDMHGQGMTDGEMVREFMLSENNRGDLAKRMQELEAVKMEGADGGLVDCDSPELLAEKKAIKEALEGKGPITSEMKEKFDEMKMTTDQSLARSEVGDGMNNPLADSVAKQDAFKGNPAVTAEKVNSVKGEVLGQTKEGKTISAFNPPKL